MRCFILLFVITVPPLQPPLSSGICDFRNRGGALGTLYPDDQPEGYDRAHAKAFELARNCRRELVFFEPGREQRKKPPSSERNKPRPKNNGLAGATSDGSRSPSPPDVVISRGPSM
eukprot:CAMPEP_0179870496 /NCGR_PEP_ID=MMETSP0982-20121206/20260_1 /TAXON_ID=483367 /ORGANISM="non described non described, Strain CCMP 2436" /LENGTH=115 /DNA_ID=CAMNT_0021760977 /DNA_START=262 /DNA_END=610 /DNA_ORIENTATION=+